MKWFERKQNNVIGYKLMFLLLAFFPPVFMRFFALPIGFFYWIFSLKTRAASKKYLATLFSFCGSKNKGSSLRHFVSFALNLVENMQSWAGKFSFKNVHWQDDDVGDLVQNINSGHGTVVVISHLGNAQMLKALASIGESGTERDMSITTISDINLSKGFYATLSKINPKAAFHIVNSNDIGPETIILLQERLEHGETVVVAGDRIGVHSNRTVELPFLGRNADFPYGVFLLISLLNAPAYFVWGLRNKDITLFPEYNMYVRKNPVDFSGSRKERGEKILQTVRNFVKNLEDLCVLNPYQWYNFFDFWKE